MPHAMRQQPFQHRQPDRLGPAVTSDIVGLASAVMIKQDRRQPAPTIEMHKRMLCGAQDRNPTFLRGQAKLLLRDGGVRRVAEIKFGNAVVTPSFRHLAPRQR